jgi:hypothetical protein
LFESTRYEQVVTFKGWWYINMPLFLDTAHDNLNMEFFVMENLITRWINVEKKVNLKDRKRCVYIYNLKSEWYYKIIKVLKNLHDNFLEFSLRKKKFLLFKFKNPLRHNMYNNFYKIFVIVVSLLHFSNLFCLLEHKLFK